jgi:hypothetical protein
VVAPVTPEEREAEGCQIHGVVNGAIPARCPVCWAYDVVDRAYDECVDTLDGPPEQRAHLDFSVEGESILVRHISEALRAARAS